VKILRELTIYDGRKYQKEHYFISHLQKSEPGKPRMQLFCARRVIALK